MRQDPRQGLKDKLLSSGLLRDPNAPSSLSAADKEIIEALPEYSAAKKSVTEMRIILKTKYGRKYVENACGGERANYKRVKSNVNNVRRKLEKERLDTMIKEYFTNVCNNETRRQFEEGTKKAVGKVELDILSGCRQLGERVGLLWDMVCEKLGSQKLKVDSDDRVDSDSDDKVDRDQLDSNNVERDKLIQWDCVYCDAVGFSTNLKYTLKKHVVGHLGKLEEPWCMKCNERILFVYRYICLTCITLPPDTL